MPCPPPTVRSTLLHCIAFPALEGEAGVRLPRCYMSMRNVHGLGLRGAAAAPQLPAPCAT